jgi:hypothetical protein
MGHFFASAKAPSGLGVELGTIVEIQQGISRAGSAHQGEDYKANILGAIFGKYYMNSRAKGNTFKERLANFFQDYQNDTLRMMPVDGGYNTLYSQTPSSNQEIPGDTSNSDNPREQVVQSVVPTSTLGQNSPGSLARQQNTSIEELIFLNFSVKPGELSYDGIFRNVLTEIKKENPAIDIQAIANVAGISLQQQLII